MTSILDGIETNLSEFKVLSAAGGPKGFLGQEALRFYSVAGTCLAAAEFKLDDTATPEERYITHPLTRSLLENLFWILYIFDDHTKTSVRYDELINSFRREYSKMLNDVSMPTSFSLPPADASWSGLRKGLDINSMLAQITNAAGDRMSFLYIFYRIASFDTHGKSLENLYNATFSVAGNFPVLQVSKAFTYIADEYLTILGQLRARGEL